MSKLLSLPRAGIIGIPLALMVATSIIYAQVGGGYDLSWNTVDGGGATTSTGGIYTLGGTIGQPDAGRQTGGIFSLTGGFWGVADPALVGHVSWQGRTAGTAPYQLPITLTLKAGTTEVNLPAQTTNTGGYFTATVGSLPNGVYNWRVKNPKYLANSGTVTLSGTSVTTQEMGLMRAGDANNDNIVSVLDFNILKGTFGKACGNPGYDDRADFTGDCLVNVTDFNPLKGNFGTSGSPPLRLSDTPDHKPYEDFGQP